MCIGDLIELLVHGHNIRSIKNPKGGVFCNFGFGLRKKSWKFGFGGVFCNFRFGLRKKIGNLDLGGGVFWKGDGKRKKPTLQKN